MATATYSSSMQSLSIWNYMARCLRTSFRILKHWKHPRRSIDARRVLSASDPKTCTESGHDGHSEKYRTYRKKNNVTEEENDHVDDAHKRKSGMTAEFMGGEIDVEEELADPNEETNRSSPLDFAFMNLETATSILRRDVEIEAANKKADIGRPTCK